MINKIGFILMFFPLMSLFSSQDLIQKQDRSRNSDFQTELKKKVVGHYERKVNQLESTSNFLKDQISYKHQQVKTWEGRVKEDQEDLKKNKDRYMNSVNYMADAISSKSPKRIKNTSEVLNYEIERKNHLKDRLKSTSEMFNLRKQNYEDTIKEQKNIDQKIHEHKAFIKQIN